MASEDVKSMLDEGNALLRQNRLEAAQAWFAAGMERFPDQLAARERFAHVCFLRRDHEEAGRRYAALMASHPANPVGYVGWGNVLVGLGLAEEAREHFSRCAGRFPGHPQILERLGHVARLGGDLDAAYISYEALRRGHPDLPTGYFGLGSVLLDLELFEEAEAFVATTIARFPNHPGLKDVYALTALRGLDYDAAYRRYARLDREHPGSPAGWLGLGSVLLAQRLYDEAEEHFRRGMERFPDAPAMWDRYAQVPFLRQDHDEAYIRYTALRNAHPDTPFGFLGQGNVLYEQRLYDEAQEVFTAAVARFPEHVPLRQRQAMTAVRRWDIQGAMSRFEEIILTHPHGLTGYLGKAHLLVQLNKLVEADAYLAWCLERFPRSLALRDLHALVLFRRGRYDEAHARYEALKDLYPRATAGYLGVIRILLRKKMFDEAHAMLVWATTNCRFSATFLKPIIGFFLESLLANVHVRKPEITDLLIDASARSMRDELPERCHETRNRLYSQLINTRSLVRALASRPGKAGSGRVNDGRKSLLIFGDSHVRTTFHNLPWFASLGVNAWLFPVPGASIAGLGRRHSTLDLIPKIEKCLQKYEPEHLLLKFGQVDVDYGYSYRKYVKGDSRLDFSRFSAALIEAYLDAVAGLGKNTKLAICSINIPSVFPRENFAKITQDVIAYGEMHDSSVNYYKLYALQPSIGQRTKMSMDFNRSLALGCQARNIHFIDLTPLFLDTETNLAHEFLCDETDSHYKTSDLHKARIIDYTMEKLYPG